MKIEIDKIDRGSFMVHEHVVNGEVVYLVQPCHFGCKWTQNNKYFRSSVWNHDGELISASFPKFVNWEENPDNFPVPKSLKNATVVEKIDGSTLIVSKYKGNYILRTRGTVDATSINNGYELNQFKQTILPKLSDVHLVSGDTWNYSFLFEWVSSANKIVLNYGDEPDWFLIGIVCHADYRLIDQFTLDRLALQHGLKRPTIYNFTAIDDLLKDVDAWKDKEGVVVYSNYDQMLHKVKAMHYLICHRFKSEATLEKTLELYFYCDQPQYQEFSAKLIQTFDYECFQMVRGYALQICDARKKVDEIVDEFRAFIETHLKSLPSRKDQAQKVLADFGQNNRASFVFTLLDGRSLSDEQLKKLFWQVLSQRPSKSSGLGNGSAD